MAIDLSTIKLSVGYELLGEVSPNMRAVAVSNRDHIVNVRFIFDGHISQTDHNHLEDIAIEIDFDDVSKDDQGRSIELHYSGLRCDFPRKMVFAENEELVFLRYEENMRRNKLYMLLKWLKFLFSRNKNQEIQSKICW